MKLRNPESLAAELEKGLGQLHSDGPTLDVPDNLQLAMPRCGIVSLALAHKFDSAGFNVKLYESRPTFTNDPQWRHVFPVVNTRKNEHYVIDATYRTFYEHVGLTPYGIMLSDRSEEEYPPEKIAMFNIANDERIRFTRYIGATAATILKKYSEPTDGLGRLPSFYRMNGDDLANAAAAVWEPRHCVEFAPPLDVRIAGLALSRLISPDSVRFMDS